MSCSVVACPIGKKHHHHTRDGVTSPTACFCPRPEKPGRPTTEQLLDFAAAHPGPLTGRVDEQIHAELGITPTRYLQLLTRDIDTDAALAHDPITTHRLRREAEHRARTREARTNGR